LVQADTGFLPQTLEQQRVDRTLLHIPRGVKVT